MSIRLSRRSGRGCGPCGGRVASSSSIWRSHWGFSSAYLSALERGERGRPTWALIQGTIHYFGVIWDEADELQHLAEMSEPRPQIDARGTGPQGGLSRQPPGARFRRSGGK